MPMHLITALTPHRSFREHGYVLAHVDPDLGMDWILNW